MQPELVGAIAIIGLFVLLFLRVPISFVLGFLALVGYILIQGAEAAFSLMGLITYAKVSSYILTVVPLFILMGYFAADAGLAHDLFDTAQKWVSGLPGGLVQATIAGSTALGAVSGSGLASCAVVSKITVPEMLRLGVDRKLAVGAVASAGTIAAMIPPSILMVIYGVITEQSIGKLLIAGVIPGLIAGFNFMLSVFVRVKLNPNLAPSLKGITWSARFISLKGLWGTIILATLVIGGIYSGIFTPTEAGGMGAFGAFLLSLKRMKWKMLRETLWETMKTTSMIFFLIANAFLFGYLMSVSGLPTRVSEAIIALPPMALVAGIMVLYIILGFFMDMVAALFITLPIFLPALHAANINLIWFGVLVVCTCEMALITPPFGLNLFVIKGVVPEAEMKDIIAGIWPFFGVMLINLAIYILFPQVALFLPEVMMGR